MKYNKDEYIGKEVQLYPGDTYKNMESLKMWMI